MQSVDLSRLPIEEQLLLASARTQINEADAKRIRDLVQQKVDWDFLIRLAHRNGIEPLLVLSLKRAASDLLPENVHKRLNDFFLKNAGHNLFLAKELAKLMDLFRANGIQTIPYKGPLMTVDIYGDLSYRQFGDLDFLLEQRDILKVKKLLIDADYRPVVPMTPAGEKNYLTFENSYDFVRGNVLLEMHWEVVPRYFFSRIDVSELWSQLIPVVVNGVEMRTVCREDLFLILCVDASRELWERLARICDIAQLLYFGSEINWDKLLQKAERIGCRRMLLVGSSIAHQILAAPLPDLLTQWISRETEATTIASRMAGRLLERREAVSILGESRFQPLYLQMRERLQDRLGHTLSLFFTPSVADWEIISLPEGLSFFYYLIRPFRLASKFGSKMLRRLWK